MTYTLPATRKKSNLSLLHLHLFETQETFRNQKCQFSYSTDAVTCIISIKNTF